MKKKKKKFLNFVPSSEIVFIIFFSKYFCHFLQKKWMQPNNKLGDIATIQLELLKQYCKLLNS